MAEKEKQLEELGGNQKSSSGAPPRCKREEGTKGNVRRGATAREAVEKSRRVRVIETKKVRGDDPIEYFLPTGSEVSFEFQRG